MKNLKIALSMACLSTFFACNKSEEAGKSPISLLTADGQKVWVVSASSENGVPICVSACEKENQTLTFKKSGTVIFSTYDCSDAPCSTGSSSQTGGEVPFSISNDNKVITFGGSNGISANILGLTETELVFEETFSADGDKIVTTFVPKK